jgi:hypothetical protein
MLLPVAERLTCAAAASVWWCSTQGAGGGTQAAPPSQAAMAITPVALPAAHLARALGSARRDDAKMSGITPVALTLKGR